MKLSREDKIYKIISVTFVIIVVVITFYPFLYVAACSISDPVQVMQNKVFLFPKGFSLKAYRKILEYDPVKIGYMNTIFYTVVGTIINMILTSLTAYPLSRKKLFGKKFLTIFVAFTLMFSGGLIPTYLVVKNLNLLDTRWALILPTAISTWNLLLLKSFFQSIPVSLEEAAVIDGCSHFQILYKIVLPLSKPALATISLFYAVNHWNSFFNAMIYLSDQRLYPIQIFLRNIVIQSETADLIEASIETADDIMMTAVIKYATVMVVAIPIMIIYPFIQKYFVKGVMIGSLKG